MSTRPIDVPFVPALDQSQRVRRSLDRPLPSHDTTSGCACAFSLHGAHGEAYNEPAFRYFLDIEQKRAATSNQPCILLLVDIHDPAGTPVRLDDPDGQKLMAALLACVRETDFVGWYRDRLVAGAVLTLSAEFAQLDSQDAVSARVTRVLSQRLPSALATMARVRLYRAPVTLPSAS